MEMTNTRRAVLDAFAAKTGGPKRAYFRDDGGPASGGGVGGEGADPPADTPASDPSPGPQEPPAPPVQPAQSAQSVQNPPQEPPKTFTQAQVDQMVADRLGRDRRRREEELQGKVILSSEEGQEFEQLRQDRRDRETAEARRREQEAIEAGETAKVLEEKESRINELASELENARLTERQRRLDDKRVSHRDFAAARVLDAGRLYAGAQKEVEMTFDAVVKIDHDTEEVYVIQEDGTPMTDPASGRRLTVSEGLDEWLKTRPYYLKAPPQQRGGSGTPPVNAGADAGSQPPASPGAAEPVNGKAPIVGADGQMYFSRSMLRLPNGMTDGEFIEKYRGDLAKAQQEGRYWDDVQGHPAPTAIASQVGAAGV